MKTRKQGQARKSHYTDPDYGITEVHSARQIILRLRYIDTNGEPASVTPSWTYHSAAGRETALNEARRERAKLLAKPEFQAYITRTYIERSERSYVRPRSHPGKRKGVIAALPGVRMSLLKHHPKVVGRPVNYLNVVAQAPGPDGKPKLRAWSVRKHGLVPALRAAAQWRFDYVGDLPPTEDEIQLALQQVLAEYGQYLTELQSRAMSE